MVCQFPISSDQMSLLIGLESSNSLDQLSQILHKEKSVISKNLKRLHQDFPTLIEKKNRRWEVTDDGRKVIQLATKFINELNQQLPSDQQQLRDKKHHFSQATLMIMNAQKAFESSELGEPSNVQALQNIERLLQKWRNQNQRIVFVKHESDNPQSPLHASSPLSGFMESLRPKDHEKVIIKKVANALADVDFDNDLEEEFLSELILVGFTAAECIDATARDAQRLEIPAYIVADAISTSNLMGPSGEIFHSKLVLGITLANLHNKVAHVLETDSLLSDL